MVSWWVQYLAKVPRPDFNNGPRTTQIVAAFLAPGVYSSPTPIMALPSQSNLGQLEYTSVQVSHLWSPGGCNIWPRAPGLTSIMAQGLTQIVALFWSPAFIRANGPSPGNSNFGYFCSGPPHMVFWWALYLAKRPRPDFNNGSGDNSNCGCILGPRHLFEFD